jgi:HPt (histidine-containing phosphotransfer) domain-containing protein
MHEADKIDAQLDALKEKYASRLGERIAEIERVWGGVKAAGGAEAVDDLTRLVHKLAGSAGMYGQKPLGEAARTLETALEAEPAEAVSSDASVHARIEALIEALTAALD